MKLVAMILLVAGILCNSMLAMSEGPVPFRALMKSTGAEPGIPSLDDANDQSSASSTLPAHRPPMTSGGRIMTGFGIGMFAVGGVVIVGTALLSGWDSSHKGELYGTGAGLFAGGATLIVFGDHHRRPAQ
jgi:hypothetical protein